MRDHARADADQSTAPDAAAFSPDRYFTGFAAAFVRGQLDPPDGLSDVETCAWGAAQGLRLHRFKRKMPLPRVERVLGVIAQFAPATLLDVGAGRGTFLWPALDRFGDLSVTVWEKDPIRAAQLAAVAAGGITTMHVHEGDVATAPETVDGFEGSVEVVTALEVLEHVDDPLPVASACVTAASRAVVVSVPSEDDDNPGHIRRFTRDSLERLLTQAGAERVGFDQVRGHIIAVATGVEPR